MRTREEIEEDVAPVNRALVEVLLDIRDLLEANKNKIL